MWGKGSTVAPPRVVCPLPPGGILGMRQQLKRGAVVGRGCLGEDISTTHLFGTDGVTGGIIWQPPGQHEPSIPALHPFLEDITTGRKAQRECFRAESRVNPFAAGWVFASSAPNNPCATQSGASTSGSEQDQDQDQLLFLPLSARTTQVLTSELNSHLGTRAFEEQRSPGASRSIPSLPIPPRAGPAGRSVSVEISPPATPM